jgi:hypothetical protein
MGTAPSIMDYARFNYVAQPEDGAVGLMPDIGLYDIWSIQYGYRLIKDATPESERPIINNWIKEKADNPVYRFGRQRGLPTDPTAQTEDIGDNSIKASEYGIKNLQRIVPNLVKWMGEDTKGFEELKEFYDSAIGQFNRYMGHVTANIGGVSEYYKTYDENSPVYFHTDKARQKDALRFLHDQLFTTPLWIADKNILSRIEEHGNTERIRSLQERTLNLLLMKDRLLRMQENEALNGDKAYKLTEMMDDLTNAIFTEVKSKKSIDIYRRNLQRTYVDALGKALEQKDNAAKNSDITATVRAQIKKIDTMLATYASNDISSTYHKDDLRSRIKNILDPK